ncbi:metalloprotease [Coemansia sp. RSA 922]|nr:metalloprotease [Coemansia sp. RSA 922]
MNFCKNYPLPDWTLGFEHRKSLASQLPYEEYTGPMEKSASDTNDYRLIRLPNNLVVMCVQDTETETAAATLSVDVGSNMDPVELQGLAHFLEHMLFMKDCIDRELCAVDSEFKGLESSEYWRLHQIECKLFSSGHPYSKFKIGNIKTLQQGAKDHGLDLHKELLKFYNKYYSSDIMKLVVYGNHTLDQLVEWAASKFSNVKSRGDSVQRIVDHPVSAEFLGKAVYYETVNDTHTMSIYFPVPDVKAMYRSDPFNYIFHLISHKGHGSITAHLKKKGWATGLSVFTSIGENKGLNEFNIAISATPEGLDRYEDILRVVFAYVQMLVSSGPQEWIQQDVSSMMKIDFNNEDKIDAIPWVTNYAYLIHNEYVAPEHILSKDKAYEMFDFDTILHCLSFISPDNFRVFIGALKHKSVDCSEIEPYFGAAYHVDSLSADLLDELARDDINVDGLSLPEKNAFIPDDLFIKNPNMLGTAVVLRPTLLRLNDSFELWFKQDDQFNTPKGSIYLCIKVPNVNSSPQNWIMSNLYCDMLNSELLEDLYNSTCAERIKAFKVNDMQLSMHMAEYRQKYANIVNDPPSQLCAVYKSYITSTAEWHHQLLASELSKITSAKLQAHVDSLFDVTYTKMCMVGNFDETEALKVADNVQAVIKPTSNLGYSFSKLRSYNIEAGYYVYQMQVPNEDCVNSAVKSHIYCGSATNKREAAILEILEEPVHDGFFAQLRTKHQLGYKVYASTSSYLGGRGELVLLVEGESNPMNVTLHVNKYIHDMQQRLLDMSDEQFTNRVQSLVRLYQERLKNVDQEVNRYLGTVYYEAYDFAYYDEMAKLLQSIEKDELLEFWNKYVNPSTAPAYTRIDVQMWSTKIWKPTVSDFKEYSAKTLALYGCLRSEGNDALDIGKVDEFIKTAIAGHKEQADASDDSGSLIAELKNASLSASEATYTAGESAERATHTATALELAIKDHETFGNYAEVSHTNFATIGMDKTPDGMWLITDYRKFQSTQSIYGSVLPAEVLVPKYSS